MGPERGESYGIQLSVLWLWRISVHAAERNASVCPAERRTGRFSVRKYQQSANAERLYLPPCNVKNRGGSGTGGLYGAGHWTPGQISQIRAQKAPECDFISLFATMNMLYSDYSEVAKKHGVDNTDFYVDMAKAFLEDPDGRPDKISAYIHCMGK